MAVRKKARKKTPTKSTRGRPKGAWTAVSAKDLTSFRKTSGMTLKSLAEALKVTTVTVGNWLSGRSVPSDSKQNEIAALIKSRPARQPARVAKKRQKQLVATPTAGSYTGSNSSVTLAPRAQKSAKKIGLAVNGHTAPGVSTAELLLNLGFEYLRARHGKASTDEVVNFIQRTKAAAEA